MQKFDRAVFDVSRASEFFSEDELAKQIGYARGWWAAALLKELIDNALDAGEQGGPGPEVRVTVGPDQLAVEDSGPGIPPEVVVRSLNYLTRTSDKVAYVSPTRGRQGNALKTIYPVGYVLTGTEGLVEIEARGVWHAVRVSYDPVKGEPVIGHSTDPSEVKTGSVFRVRWPDVASSLTRVRAADFYDEDICPPGEDHSDEDQHLAGYMRSARLLVRAYSLFNPHAGFAIAFPGQTPGSCCTPRRPAWEKWRASDKIPPHWYTPDKFAALVAALARAGRRDETDQSIRQFVGTFRGLSGTQKQQQVYADAGLRAGTLSELLGPGGIDQGQTDRLLAAMKDNAARVDAKKLGVIGKEAFKEGLIGLAGAEGAVRYDKVEGEDPDGVPFVLEVGFGYATSGSAKARIVMTGVNWSPALRLPFEGLADALQDSRVDEGDPVVLAVHLAYPAAAATDRGKSRYDLPGNVSEAVGELVRKLAAPWRKAKDKAGRTRRVERRELARLRSGGKRAENEEIKRAAYEAMKAAYREASAGVGLANARQVMYAARPYVLAATGGKCWKDSGYFTQTLLPDFVAEHPELCRDWDVVFDARGHFLEPHTGHRVDLGTLAVRDYLGRWIAGGCGRAADEPPVVSARRPTCGPANRFNAVLFVEKEGFGPLFERTRIADRFDVALMSTKGMTVTAARSLIERLSEAGVTVFVLRDFDKSGFGILHTMRTSNRRHTFRAPPRVVDLGLRLADADAVGVPEGKRELVTYDTEVDPRVRLRQYGATEDECNFLVKEKKGLKLWEGRRVELNALTSEQLVRFVERKLAEHGVRKVVPDAATLEDTFERAWRADRMNAAIKLAADHVKQLPAPPPPAELAVKTRRILSDNPELPWEAAVERVLRGTTSGARVA